MNGLRQQFRVVSLIQAIRDAKNDRLPRRAVAITFDDGYADNATVAVPILRRLGLTATFFVTSGFLDGGRMWNDTLIESVRSWEGNWMDLSALGLGVHRLTTVADRINAIEEVIRQTKYLPPPRRNEIVNAVAERANRALPDDLMMTTSQVRGLLKQGMDVGAHTMTHPILASLSDDEADREIREGKAALEAILGQPVALFAYPNGKPSVDYTSRHVESVRRAGFCGAVSTAIGAATAASDPFQVPRFTPWAQEPASFGMQLAQNFLRTRYPKA